MSARHRFDTRRRHDDDRRIALRRHLRRCNLERPQHFASQTVRSTFLNKNDI